MTGKIAQRLAERGIALPRAATPAANYVPAVAGGGLLFISGQLPVLDGERRHQGKLGAGITIEEGYAAARLCGLNIVAQILAHAGDLDRVARIVKLTGFVNSTPDFEDQPKVVNGASDLMAEIFGEAGRHARSAVGVAALPFGVAVEVEAIVEIA